MIGAALEFGEALVSLDGVKRRLSPSMLVIADARDAVGLGGIIGGAESEISKGTTRLLLESASFDAANNRHTAQELKLRTEATIRGPVPLPTEKDRYTVIRSPHKDKDSREHFEMRVHKRLLDILDPSPKTVDSLQRLDLPAGVDIEIKIQQA